MLQNIFRPRFNLRNFWRKKCCRRIISYLRFLNNLMCFVLDFQKKFKKNVKNVKKRQKKFLIFLTRHLRLAIVNTIILKTKL